MISPEQVDQKQIHRAMRNRVQNLDRLGVLLLLSLLEWLRLELPRLLVLKVRPLGRASAAAAPNRVSPPLELQLKIVVSQ